MDKEYFQILAKRVCDFTKADCTVGKNRYGKCKRDGLSV